MSITGAIALYFIVWWLTLFAMLPIGVRSQHEEGGDIAQGTDPGAPKVPMIAKKALWTTFAAIPVTALIYAWIVWFD
jgi:predicted secreted protein